jgi:hypothetical protein
MLLAPCCRRLVVASLASFVTVALAAAQGSAHDKSTWSLTGSVGLAAPLGAWRSDLDAGRAYRLAVSRSRGGSPWIFEAELARHPFDFSETGLTARNDGSARGYIRQTSLGLGVRRLVIERTALSGWFTGGLSLHSVRTSTWRDAPLRDHTLLRDEFVPGLNLGVGLALGRFRVQPLVDVRLQYVALRERPLISMPVAIGLRF